MKINVYKIAATVMLTSVALQGICEVHSTNMKVSATVLTACTVSTLPLMFKEYNPLSAKPLEAETLLTVRCNNSMPYTIMMNAGTNAKGKHYDYNNQAMTGKDPKQKLYYNIYTEPTFSDMWGDGATNGSVAVYGVGNGAANTIPVYGRILAEQKAIPDRYEDTVTIIIQY